MSDQVEALAGMLKRIPPPIRTATAQEMAAAGVRHQPDSPPVDDIDRLRQIDAIGGLLKRIPGPARVLMATDLFALGFRIPLPERSAKVAAGAAQSRPLGPESDSPMRAALRIAHPELLAKIDAAEKARAEGDDTAANELIAELRPKALEEFQSLRTQAAKLTPEDFER